MAQTPSLLVVESWSPRRTPLGEIADAAYDSGVVRGRDFTTCCGSREGTEGERRDSGAFVRSSLVPSTAVFRPLEKYVVLVL